MTTLCSEKNFHLSDFLLSLPYLNDDGDPVVIDISRWDATRFVDNMKTHKFTQVSPFIYLITPIVAPLVGVEYIKGQEKV